MVDQLCRSWWGTNIGKPNADGTFCCAMEEEHSVRVGTLPPPFLLSSTKHRWLLNTSQDMLAGLPKHGPTVNGPYSQWGGRAGDPCDFDTMREVSMRPVEHGGGVFCWCCEIDPEVEAVCPRALAAFMMWMRPGIYELCDPHESRWGGHRFTTSGTRSSGHRR